MKKKVILTCCILLSLILILIVIKVMQPNKLTIGLVPSSNPEEMLKNFKPIESYLEKEMGVEIDVMVPENYLGLIEKMKEKKVDIGWFGAFSYIIAEREVPLEPMVIQYRNGYGLFYHAIIIVRKDSNIKSIEDLEGKSFAFVDGGSTSGFVIPSALLKSRDIDAETYFSEIQYVKSHDNVAKGVLDKTVDAGAMEDLTFTKMIANKEINEEDYLVLWTSDEIPGSPFIARADLSNHLKDSFKSAMLSIHEKDPTAIKSYDARIEKYVTFEDKLYNGIRNVANILGDDFVIEHFLK
ncbi:MAG: phosphate/phosphite/phosphonate ABC transporter substrate-binding protein [Vallitaleaceae bacterium]|nr:phosphate/phosphite/phosphonate ABC transporter substrate-binding protein [Vallitaleaceae bacterium]